MFLAHCMFHICAAVSGVAAVVVLFTTASQLSRGPVTHMLAWLAAAAGLLCASAMLSVYVERREAKALVALHLTDPWLLLTDRTTLKPSGPAAVPVTAMKPLLSVFVTLMLLLGIAARVLHLSVTIAVLPAVVGQALYMRTSDGHGNEVHQYAAPFVCMGVVSAAFKLDGGRCWPYWVCAALVACGVMRWFNTVRPTRRRWRRPSGLMYCLDVLLFLVFAAPYVQAPLFVALQLDGILTLSRFATVGFTCVTVGVKLCVFAMFLSCRGCFTKVRMSRINLPNTLIKRLPAELGTMQGYEGLV